MKEDRIRPSGIMPFPDAENFTVKRGDRSDLVTILQIMLCALTLYYDDFGAVAPCGDFNAATEASGRVDVATWNMIAEEFNAAVYENQ